MMCLCGSLMPAVLPGCQSIYYTSGTIEPIGISVSTDEFRYLKKDREIIRPYIIVRNESLEFPIYLYRFSDDQYAALLMKCTHQGNELQASGDHLSCSAHGSEFNNRGVVVQGPADRNLRSFNVVVENEKLIINLTA
jgi:Rieske Fe-S protein